MADDRTPLDETAAELDADEDFDDDDYVDPDEALSALSGRLDDALASLNDRNARIEDYLQQLKEERRRDLQGTDADQLTFDDHSAVQARPDDRTTAEGGATA